MDGVDRAAVRPATAARDCGLRPHPPVVRFRKIFEIHFRLWYYA